MYIHFSKNDGHIINYHKQLDYFCKIWDIGRPKTLHTLGVYFFNSKLITFQLRKLRLAII